MVVGATACVYVTQSVCNSCTQEIFKEHIFKMHATFVRRLKDITVCR